MSATRTDRNRRENKYSMCVYKMYNYSMLLRAHAMLHNNSEKNYVL